MAKRHASVSSAGGGSSSSYAGPVVAGASTTCRLAPDSAAQSQFALRVAEAAESLPPDLHLIAADGSRHPAHRLVLSARSPFFLKMLSSGMREQTSGEVHLPDVENERLSAVLAWMYGREAVVDLSSASVALSLLELAKRWEIGELCDQLSTCEACTLGDANVLPIWESAQRLSLNKLESRCREFVMGQMAALLKAGLSSLPPSLKGLSPVQLKSLLESDDLPVASETEVLELALAYIKEQGGALSLDEVDEVLLTVRWRLVPGPVIADKAMRDPAMFEASGERLRPRLLAALADGMQFQFLGGSAWQKLPGTPANRLRAQHRIPIRGYCGLAPGMAVRVISDVEHLRILCKRCAPGARLKVEWISEMRSLAGATCRVKELRDEICGAQLEDPLEHVDRYLPYDALLLA